MGFCYPGTGRSGDLPPRPECAPLWHARILATLQDKRLTRLVGSHAQQRYLPATKHMSLSQRVRNAMAYGPAYLPLPHPSWRSTGWMTKNPWFENELLPVVRNRVAQLVW